MSLDPDMPPAPATPRHAVGDGEGGAWRLKQRCFAHRRDIGVGTLPEPSTRDVLPTGFALLDRHLPGGGWPLGALVEILVPAGEPGCLWIVLPALRALGRQMQWMAMISPPRIPYAPALAAHGIDTAKILLVHPRAHGDALWAVEEALRADTCSSTLFWLHGPDHKTLRRLQLAAEQGHSMGFCFRPAHHAGQRTTAAVRIRVHPTDDGALVDIVKARGGRPRQALALRFSDIGYA